VPAGSGETVEIAGEFAEVVAGAAEEPPKELLAPTAAHPQRITFRANAASSAPKPSHFRAASSRHFLGSTDRYRRLHVFTSRAPFDASVFRLEDAEGKGKLASWLENGQVLRTGTTCTNGQVIGDACAVSDLTPSLSRRIEVRNSARLSRLSKA